AHLRRFLRRRYHALLEPAWMGAAKESARLGELHFLRRLESAFCRALVYHHGDGLLAGSADRESAGSTRQEAMVGRQRLHEPEHARFFQIWKFPASEFSVAARAHRNHLSTAPPRYSSAGRHFFLHFSFSLLHARHLSRRAATDAIAARFRSRRVVFPAAGRRTNC